MGIKAWSGQTADHLNTGFHYTLIIGLLLLVGGYCGAKYYLKEIHPRLVKNSFPVFLLLLFLTPSLASGSHELAMSFKHGINAVEYIPNASECNYRSELPAGAGIYNYKIRLKNYSNDKLSFNMRVQKPDAGGAKIDVPVNDPIGKPQEFILAPQEEKQFEFELQFRDAFPNSSGSLKMPQVTLYNSTGTRQFKGY